LKEGAEELESILAYTSAGVDGMGSDFIYHRDFKFDGLGV